MGAVAGQQLLAPLAGDEVGHLRREEARQLHALAVKRGEQPRIGDRDRRLIGKRRHQPDLVVGEHLGLRPRDAEHAQQLAIGDDRHAQQCAVAGAAPLAAPVTSAHVLVTMEQRLTIACLIDKPEHAPVARRILLVDGAFLEPRHRFLGRESGATGFEHLAFLWSSRCRR